MALSAGASKSLGAPTSQGKSAARSGKLQTSSAVQGPKHWEIYMDSKVVTPRPLLAAVAVESVDEMEGIKEEDEAEEEKQEEEAEEVKAERPKLERKPSRLMEQRTAEAERKKLDAVHEQVLKETSTEFLLALPSLCIPIEPHEVHTAVSDRNKEYDRLQASKASSDQFVSHHTQSLNNPSKAKEVHAAPPAAESVGLLASQWDIYDTFVNPATSKAEQLQMQCDKDCKQMVATCLRKPGCLLRFDADHAKTPKGSPSPGSQPSGTPVEEAKEELPWKLGAENAIHEELLKPLRIMERIVSQNTFHKQHMVYRNYPTLEEMAKLETQRLHGGAAKATDSDDEEEDEGARDEPSLQDLFCFESQQLTQGLCVTNADWNFSNPDLLAVSYGATAPVQSGGEGLVLFWSLKNPTYPERVLRTPSGVTALDFSSVHPNLIAAGLRSGSVMIWDLRKPQQTPVLESGPSTSTHGDRKHTDVVWESTWVDRGADKVPRTFLATVGSDGRVLQWSMKKGLEQTNLMQLKRVPNPNLGSNSVHGHKEGLVFRQASGFCIDFPKCDPSTYLVGTEDGLIHRCSTSYNEQYLDTYCGKNGHSGPVYKVRCSPFWDPDGVTAFLTCSADWTIKIWSTKSLPGMPSDEPIQTYVSTDLSDAVNDVYWSPHNSTSFAAAMDDGRVELWDLKRKPLDPIIVHYPRELHSVRRTCVRFATNSPVLVAGGDDGCVDVMRMYNCDVEMFSEAEQQERLRHVTTKKP